MSQRNVEVVRASFEAWNAGDWDVYGELLDANAMVRTVEDWPEAGAYTGRETVVQFFKQIRDAWETNELELIGDSIHAADRVVQSFAWHGAGRGPDARLEITGVYTIRNGKIAVQEFFWDRAEALQVVGLSEQNTSQAISNVELVRSIFAAWERGDFSADEWAHPEIDYVIADGLARGSWTGLAGMAEGWRGWLSPWEEFRVEAAEFRELDDERVLVLVRFSGRGKTSGLQVEQVWTKGASIFTVHGGTVTRLVTYTDYKGALADLGLAPEMGSPLS